MVLIRHYNFDLNISFFLFVVFDTELPIRTELTKIILDAKSLEDTLSRTLNGTCLSYADHTIMSNEVD